MPGSESKRSLSIGLLSMLTAWTTYVPAMVLGTSLLSSGALAALHFLASARLASFIDSVFDPFVTWITS